MPPLTPIVLQLLESEPSDVDRRKVVIKTVWVEIPMTKMSTARKIPSFSYLSPFICDPHWVLMVRWAVFTTGAFWV